jgi:nitrogen regulatory protein P-II 1
MITSIMGYGNQKGYKQIYRGNEYNVNLLPKVKVETVVSDKTVNSLIDDIVKNLKTGNFGDGKIFVYPVNDAIRIRTNERGESAL